MNRLVCILLAIVLLTTPFITFQLLPERYELPKTIIFLSSAFFLIGIAYRTKITHSILYEDVHFVKGIAIQQCFSLLLLCITITSVYDGEFAISFWGQAYRYQGILFWIAGTVFVLLITKYKEYGIDRIALLKIMAVSGMLCALIVIAQWCALAFFKLDVPTYNGRIIGTMGNPNFAGGYMALTIAPLTLLFHKPVLKSISICVMLIAIICTGSLSACISACVIIAILFFHSSHYWKIATVVGVLCVATILSVLLRPKSSFDSRYVIWRKALGAIAVRPLTGWGWERFERGFNSQLTADEFDLKHIRVDKAHNLWLEIATTAGIPTLCIYLFMVIRSFKILLHKKHAAYSLNLFAMLSGFEVYGFFNVIGVSQYIVWFIIMGCISSLEMQSSQ